MELKEFDIDYLCAKAICSGNGEYPNRRKIYYEANEDLVSIFDVVEVKDKDCFSVIGSGDQIITLKYEGAKKVEGFDFNRLAISHFVLRLWSIKYMNTLYPEIWNRNFMIKLLKQVKPKNKFEVDVYNYYAKLVNEKVDLDNLIDEDNSKNEGVLSYKSNEEVIPYLDSNVPLHFKDMFSPFKLDKEFDLAYISNILEWGLSEKESDSKLMIARDNLYRLLKPNGEVVCSKLARKGLEIDPMEREIFDCKFNVVFDNPINYVYRRK